MSDLPVEGTLAQPLRMGLGERIVEVHWGGFALIEITYPAGFSFEFSTDVTQTDESYSAGEVIAKVGIDEAAPLMLVMFDEPNPIGTEPDGYLIKQLFGEALLFVHPAITVINGDPFGNQARYNTLVANFNATQNAEYNRIVPLQTAARNAFLTLHPDATVFLVTDLREWFPEPSGGWGERSISFRPPPWISDGGSGPTGAFETFTHPGYLNFITTAGIRDANTGGGGANLAPLPSRLTIGRYPTYEDRKRDTYIIKTGKLAMGQVVDIRVASPTDQPVELAYLSGGDTYSAAAKRRVIVTPEKQAITKSVSGAGAVGAVIASFDRAGFVV